MNLQDVTPRLRLKSIDHYSLHELTRYNSTPEVAVSVQISSWPSFFMEMCHIYMAYVLNVSAYVLTNYMIE